MKKITLPALLLGMFGAVWQPALAFDATDKTEIHKIIREYLISNPEVIVEVQQALEIKRDREAKEKAAKALVENADIIFKSPNQASIGNKDADVTVVEFFDYNCSFCQRAMQDMNSLLSKDTNLQFVLKELPILSEGSVEV